MHTFSNSSFIIVDVFIYRFSHSTFFKFISQFLKDTSTATFLTPHSNAAFSCSSLVTVTIVLSSMLVDFSLLDLLIFKFKSRLSE